MKVVGQELDVAYTDELKYALGAKSEDDQGRKFVFLKYTKLGSLQGVAGLMAVACDSAYNDWEATCDSDNADAVPSIPYGQFQAQLDDDEMGWAQYAGWNRKAVTTDGNVVQGNELIVSSSVRGTLVTKGTHRASAGTAAAADSGTTLAAGTVFLQIPL